LRGEAAPNQWLGEVGVKKSRKAPLTLTLSPKGGGKRGREKGGIEK